MIVEMQKIYAAVKSDDRDRLLGSLREMGVVHLTPVNTEKAQIDESDASVLQRLGRALQVLAEVEPQGAAPELSGIDAADRVLEIYANSSDLRSRMGSLARQAAQIAIWGDVELDTFRQLSDAGLDIKFYKVDPQDISAIKADCVESISLGSSADTALVAVISTGGEVALPDTAEAVELPERDRPSLLAEADKLDKQLEYEAGELHRLAHLQDIISAELTEQKSQAEYTVASRGGTGSDAIYAVQGWVPAEKSDSIASGLASSGIDAGIDLQDPAEDDQPPTLITYPKWAKPMKALFDMLGTIPGYDEYDLSPFFMIAMPIFTAMLIGDAGYGLLMSLLPILMWKKIVGAAGKPAAALILTFGLVTFGWGIMTANYFGVVPADIAAKAGFATEMGADGKIAVDGVANMMASDQGGLAAVGRVMTKAAIFYRTDGDAGRNLIIMISFIIGTAHLVVAQLRQAVGKAPSITCISHIGWGVFLVGMLGVVWMLFFPAATNPDIQWISTKGVVGLLAVGAALVVLFSFPSKNPVKTIMFGIAGNLLPMISTFSDTMSYIRLMAVGLASFYIAWAFNGMAMSISQAGWWAWIFAIIILVLGHGLNIFLALIAVLAHGVRLNMLEFSNNVGVQWYGYAYAPFGADSK